MNFLLKDNTVRYTWINTLKSTMFSNTQMFLTNIVFNNFIQVGSLNKSI